HGLRLPPRARRLRVPGGHARAPRAPRAAPGRDGQGREPRRARGRAARDAARAHVERAGERPHARDQRGPRVPPRGRVGRLAAADRPGAGPRVSAGTRTTPGPSATPPAGAGRVGVRLVPVPASLDAPDAWAVHGTVHVGDAIHREISGHTDLALDAATVVTTVANDGYRRVPPWAAVLDAGATDADPPGPARAPRPEDVVGRSMGDLPQRGNTHVAVVYVGVHPDHRRRGVGSALWDAATEVVRAQGRRVVMSDSSFAPEPPPGPGALEAPAGSGRVPLDDDATSFALRRGFALEQVMRHSALDLPVPAETLDPLRAAATRRADGYRVHVWTDEVPEEWIDQFAVLETRMSTDAPSGGLDL